MATIICMDCNAEIEGARQRRRCDACRKRHNSRRSIRTLQPGEAIPHHEPGRYLRSHGYILLRWRVGVRTYVEAYEHRILNGRIVEEEHVHHLNGDRTDNHPENLRPLSAAEHAAVHHRGRPRPASSRPSPNKGVIIIKPWHTEAARLYREGLSTYQIGERVGRNPASVYRALVKLEVPLRSENRIAIPHREREEA